MTNKYYFILVFMIIILFFISPFKGVYADEPLNTIKIDDQKKLGLNRLKILLEEKGKRLQDTIDNHVYNMDKAYKTTENIPVAELNAIAISRYISEQFFYYRTFLRLFINSHLEGYNDPLNKELLLHLLTFRTPAREMQHFYDVLFSKSEKIENEIVLEELDKAKDTIPLIISEIVGYEKILNQTFDGNPQ